MKIPDFSSSKSDDGAINHVCYVAISSSNRDIGYARSASDLFAPSAALTLSNGWAYCSVGFLRFSPYSISSFYKKACRPPLPYHVRLQLFAARREECVDHWCKWRNRCCEQTFPYLVISRSILLIFMLCRRLQFSLRRCVIVC